jgi:transposase
MKSQGLTAKQAAKKYGISMWTIYNWSKRRNAGKPKVAARRGRPVGSSSSRGSLAEMMRPLIAEMVRGEILRLLSR